MKSLYTLRWRRNEAKSIVSTDAIQWIQLIQDHGRDQCGKALFNMKYLKAGTFDVVK